VQSSNDVNEAARVIATGGIIAYPTEAVFGLGCDPTNQAALTKLLLAKQRAANKGLILIASTQAQLSPFMAGVTPEQQLTLDNNWPGPVTFIVPVANGISDELTGGRDTIAVRVSSHPLVVALCDACGSALVSTSANISGQAPIRSSEEWLHASRNENSKLNDKIDFLLLGNIGERATPSDIIDLQSGEHLR